MNYGWIKIHRQLKDHWIWKSDKKLKQWVDLLLTVNHESKKVLIKNQLFICERGQTIKSLGNWAKEWNISKEAVRAFFELLQKDGMIKVENIHVTTRITICNYNTYQGEVDTEKTKVRRNVDATKKHSDQSSTLNKNNKNNKELNNDNNEENKWRDDFSIYKNELDNSFKELLDDLEYLDTLEKLNPDIDIILSLEKSIFNYWGTEMGWENKKKSNINTINWKTTLSNSLDYNKVNIPKTGRRRTQKQIEAEFQKGF